MSVVLSACVDLTSFSSYNISHVSDGETLLNHNYVMQKMYLLHSLSLITEDRGYLDSPPTLLLTSRMP